MARPIPRLPPVITATLPDRSAAVWRSFRYRWLADLVFTLGVDRRFLAAIA